MYFSRLEKKSSIQKISSWHHCLPSNFECYCEAIEMLEYRLLNPKEVLVGICSALCLGNAGLQDRAGLGRVTGVYRGGKPGPGACSAPLQELQGAANSNHPVSPQYPP